MNELWQLLHGDEAAAPAAAHPASPPAVQRVAVSQLASYRYKYEDGSKYPGSYGPTSLLFTDYWTLRARSAELFSENLYARGLIRRLVVNVINTGLHLESTPEERILGFKEDGLAEWSETVENRFQLWSKDAFLCDHDERLTFGALQAMAYREALVAGDVLCMLRPDQTTRLPRVRLVNGASVQTPMAYRGANEIQHGVEIDKQKRHVAYWIAQDDGTSTRVPAFGEKSGRRIAWLLYGTDRRLDSVRGKPLLSLVLSSLKEIDRYRDSTQRKAVINSMLAMFVTSTKDSNGGTMPMGRMATALTTEATVDSEGKDRRFQTAEHVPGLVLDQLAPGEEPHAFITNGTTEAFGVFEEAVIQSIAWANNIPPEILRLSFSNNYSASQAAINEFKVFLNPERTDFGQEFCQPIYVEWLLAEVLAKRITANGILESWRDSKQYDVFAAWTLADWSGHIKPAVDVSKLVRGYAEQISEGIMTRARACRELTGMKYSKVVQQLGRENEQLVGAKKVLMELDAKTPAPAPSPKDDEPDDIDREDDEEESESRARSRKTLALRAL